MENFIEKFTVLYADYVLHSQSVLTLRSFISGLVSFEPGPELLKFLVATEEELNGANYSLRDLLDELNVKVLDKASARDVIAEKVAIDILNNPSKAIDISEEVYSNYISGFDEEYDDLLKIAFGSLDWEDGVSEDEYEDRKKEVQNEIIEIASNILNQN